MKLSVVLLTWNSEKYIAPCLEALLAAIDGYDYEIVIVDNGSTDATISLLEAYISPQVNLLKNEKNRGVAKARNQALRLVSGDFTLILDIDTVVNKTAIEALLSCIQQDEQIGIVACKLVSSTGEVQLSCRKFPSLLYKLYNAIEAKGLTIKQNQFQFYKQEMQGNTSFEVDYVIGACQFIRKKALGLVGLLDEHIFYGPEDADFCLRMKQKGWKVVYLPSVSIVHHYQQLSNKRFFSTLNFLHIKALLYYFVKHTFSKK